MKLHWDIFNRKRVAELERENANLKRRLAAWEDNDATLRRFTASTKPLTLSIARLIAKIDPLYAVDESDPIRRAASDKLGDDVIRKLLADNHAAIGPIPTSILSE